MKPLILVDENIPEAELYFGELGRIKRFAGRNLSALDLGEAKALIVRSVTKVDASLLSESQIQFVGTCTIGTDHIDKQWLATHGIGFSSAPGSNANSVAEYVIAALAFCEIDWQKLTFGIIGCGNVGVSVYRKLLMLGADVVGNDPLIDQHSLPNMVGISEALTRDVICIHTPLTHDGEFPTHHLISESELMHLKPNALIISAGRGAVVDNQQLLTIKKIRPDLRIVLDVWEHEPWVCKDLLARVDIGTPHVAGYSWDGKVAGTRMICEALSQFFGQTTKKIWKEKNHNTESSVPLVLSRAGWQQVRRVILQSYDIAGDDQRLRHMVVNAETKEQIAQGFDALRRHYPERREFRFSQPIAKPIDRAVRQCLYALGFQFL